MTVPVLVPASLKPSEADGAVAVFHKAALFEKTTWRFIFQICPVPVVPVTSLASHAADEARGYQVPDSP